MALYADCSTDDRSDADAAQRPKSEEDDGHHAGDGETGAVIGNFEFADVETEMTGDLLDKQLVHSRREIGVEEKRHACGGQNDARGEQSAPCGEGKIPTEGDKLHVQIEQAAVDKGGDEGKEVLDTEAAQDKADDADEQCLEGVLRHSEGEKGYLFRNQIRRRHHHGYAEICRRHKRRAESEEYLSQNVCSLGCDF